MKIISRFCCIISKQHYYRITFIITVHITILICVITMVVMHTYVSSHLFFILQIVPLKKTLKFNPPLKVGLSSLTV